MSRQTNWLADDPLAAEASVSSAVEVYFWSHGTLPISRLDLDPILSECLAPTRLQSRVSIAIRTTADKNSKKQVLLDFSDNLGHHATVQGSYMDDLWKKGDSLDVRTFYTGYDVSGKNQFNVVDDPENWFCLYASCLSAPKPFRLKDLPLDKQISVESSREVIAKCDAGEMAASHGGYYWRSREDGKDWLHMTLPAEKSEFKAEIGDEGLIGKPISVVTN